MDKGNEAKISSDCDKHTYCKNVWLHGVRYIYTYDFSQINEVNIIHMPTWDAFSLALGLGD